MTGRLLTMVFIMMQITPASFAKVAAETPQFSKSSGFYPSAIDVDLTTSTGDAVIRYTRDGTAPSTNSPMYQGPIRLDSTCVVRAVTFKAGIDSSRISTRTFFIAEMPELSDLPVLSISTDPSNLWDPDTGIYANPLENGDDWERPVAIEFFQRHGTLGFQTEAGIRIHGGASRQPQKSAKKSFRLYFRSKYGPAKLNYPIIPKSAIQKYDCLVLRAGYNDAWIHGLDRERELAAYVRDSLVRDVCIDMGQPASHGDFIHLFLNGTYWGMYNVSERYDDDFCDAYLGDGSWDVVKPGADENNNAIEASTGDLDAWYQFEEWFRNRDFKIASNYRDLESWIDLGNFIDFYIINIFSQNWDWPRHNWFAVRNRDNGRWKFMPWDSECTFGSSNLGYQDSMNMWQVIANQGGHPFPSFLNNLKRSEFFRDDVASRFAQQFATHLHPERLVQLLDTRLNQIRIAIPFEAERWGDARPPSVYGLNDWLDAAESMKTFIGNRAITIAAQLKTEGFVLPDADVCDRSLGSADFLLMQNHPNPFNAQTHIHYRLPNTVYITLKIYNPLGREVATLFEGVRQPGSYEAVFDGNPLATGVYLYRLTTGPFDETRRMVIIK